MTDEMLAELRKMNDEFKAMTHQQGLMQTSLDLHIYRTELAEENIKMLRDELKPISKHVIMVEGVLKFFGALAIMVSIAAGIYSIFK
jgi:hypothetical protein